MTLPDSYFRAELTEELVSAAAHHFQIGNVTRSKDIEEGVNLNVDIESTSGRYLLRRCQLAQQVVHGDFNTGTNVLILDISKYCYTAKSGIIHGFFVLKESIKESESLITYKFNS